MISLPHIPVEITPPRLAAAAEVSPAEAEAFLKEALPRLQPAGVFDEVDPRALFGALWNPQAAEPDATAIIGLCTLGDQTPGAAAQPLSPLWSGLTTLALRDILDFCEYKIRLFLKPAGRQPARRLVPGCEDLPLAATRPLLAHFGPEHSLGLSPLPSGQIPAQAGLAFVFPLAARPADQAGICAACPRQNCPARV